jgi:hypothetical protein
MPEHPYQETNMTTKYYTEAEIAEAVQLYAEFHGLDPTAVDVARNYEGDGPNVIGFRLSRDVDGAQRGDDETYGQF